MKLTLNTLINIPKSEPLLTYKKLDHDLRSPIYRFKYQINKVYVNKDFDDNPHHTETKRFYSLLPNALSKVSYPFGIRWWEVEIWGKCVVESKHMIGSEYIHLKRELSLKEMTPFMSSRDAYSICYDLKDTEEIRERIVDEEVRYNYLIHIKDRIEEAAKFSEGPWKERYLEYKRYQAMAA